MAKRKKTPKLPHQQEPAVDDAFNQRLVAMMKGEAAAPNVYCKHIIEKLLAIEKESGQQQAVRQQATDAVNNANMRLVELQGQIKAYREDLCKFDKEIITDTEQEVAQ